MVSEDQLNAEYSFEELGSGCADRPDYRKNGFTYISSPYMRDLYYIRGYNDVLSSRWREDKGKHPDNEEAYHLGQKDAAGDLKLNICDIL